MSAQGLVMLDQFDRRQELAAYRGDVVVLLYGDRHGTAANRALGERLHVQFHPTAKGMPPAQARRAPVQALPGLADGQRSPDVHLVPVACVGPVPAAVRTFLRNQLVKGSPDVAVWIDDADQMKQRFGVSAGTVNLVVVDTLGRARYKVSGELNPGNYAKLVQTIESLRREGVPAAPPTDGPPLLPPP